ncbi:MAG: alanine--tRNA ligase [Coriobacteriales bacterium]|jgi:alanyl-tRNA synthetase|nr:alanine--tRNA ligase [Coriobacteriales bacterium]
MKSAELREKYLRFFEEKGCKRVPSSSLIPDDPSMLLTSAGMVQFKPYFLQQKQLEKPYVGTTTVQKCVRTTDIDIIGTTGRHQSFFEMLGNFSFGSYFKQEMCAWAYEFSTRELGFAPERLYFSVYLDDEETINIWKSLGVPDDHIVKLGAEDNFWVAGPTGPCGPCSELYYDQGPQFGCGSPNCGPGCECDRFLEFWNCVFTQFDRQEDGTLVELPKKNIDTGMGLERTIAILQGVQSNYETDILRSLIAVAERLSNRTYGNRFLLPGQAPTSVEERDDLGMRIVADHSRALTFMIADGILPANEGRGYVLRRLLRRAMRYGQLLGIEAPFLVEFVRLTISKMGDAYPELLENQALIERIVLAEEERFAATLRQGQSYLDQHLLDVSKTDDAVIDGATAFELHDRFGFPIELTIEIASEKGISVNREGFEALMSKQRERARAHAKDDAWGTYQGVYADIVRELGYTNFTGYTHTSASAKILAIVVDGEQVSHINSGVEAHVILDCTPFYGEKGGQVGDSGRIDVRQSTENAKASIEAVSTVNEVASTVNEVASTVNEAAGTVSENAGTVSNYEGTTSETQPTFLVEDTKVFDKHLYIHIGRATASLAVGDTVTATINDARRQNIQRNHTATHLLHYALRVVLGDHVRQAGSLVAEDHLRFDFTHFAAVSTSEIRDIEALVNKMILEDHLVDAYETSLDEARSLGVTALFGEKYGDVVRVLSVGPNSRELCGGTHVKHAAQIGMMKIRSESSVGSSLRRIEAVTGNYAIDYMNRFQDTLRDAAFALKCAPTELQERIEQLKARCAEAERELKAVRSGSMSDTVDELLAAANDTLGRGYLLVVMRKDGLDVDALRSLWDLFRQRADATNIGKTGLAIVLGTITDEGCPLILAAANEAAVLAGFNANAMIKAISGHIKGGGGGKPAMAQAGGKDCAGLDAALSAAKEWE